MTEHDCGDICLDTQIKSDLTQGFSVSSGSFGSVTAIAAPQVCVSYNGAPNEVTCGTTGGKHLENTI